MKIEVTCRGADVLPIDSLENFQGNLKRISKKNLEKLKKQILTNGFNVPFFVWRVEDWCRILDGHQRLKALQALREDGYEIPLLPVAYIDADNEQDARQKLLGITSQYGEFEIEELESWMSDLDDDIAESLRFADGELEIKINEDDETEGDDEFDDKPQAITKRGDIWELNGHRVMCGNSTDAGDVGELMDGAMADQLVTDPPYNVDYEGKTKEKLKIENDAKTDVEFRQFLNDAFCIAFEAMKPGAAFYIWHADSEGYNFRGAVFDNGQKVRQCIIWNKNSMVMGRQDYHWKHEPCLYGWKAGSAHLWASDRKQTTVINHDRPSKSEEHPTMKPVGLFEYCILNNTKGGDLILDTFIGSGTALVASEKSGRICYGMELGEHYCDVTVKRWIDWMSVNNRDFTVKRNGEVFDYSVFINDAE